jgi:hypothetical protein
VYSVSAREDGGPAFPTAGKHLRFGDREPDAPGMTLRDYFAAKALQGGIAHTGLHSATPEAVQLAYMLADLMLAERAK